LTDYAKCNGRLLTDDPELQSLLPRQTHKQTHASRKTITKNWASQSFLEHPTLDHRRRGFGKLIFSYHIRKIRVHTSSWKIWDSFPRFARENLGQFPTFLLGKSGTVLHVSPEKILDSSRRFSWENLGQFPTFLPRENLGQFPTFFSWENLGQFPTLLKRKSRTVPHFSPGKIWDSFPTFLLGESETVSPGFSWENLGQFSPFLLHFSR
jgi:hypothetical protein